MLKKVMPLTVLAAMVFLAWTVSKNPPEVKRSAPKAEPALTVAVQTVARQDYPVQFERYGRVLAGQKTLLRAEAAGELLSHSEGFRPGAEIRRGQLLAQLDARQAEAELAIARAGLAESEQSYAQQQAQTEQARQAWQLSGRSGEPSARILQLPQLKAAKARLDSARNSLELARLALEKRRILAPFDGYVLSIEVQPGEVVSNGSQLAVLIADRLPEVEVSLQPSDLKRLPESGPVAVRVLSERGTFDGTLQPAAPELDSASQQLLARVTLAGSATGAAPLAGELVRTEISGRTLSDVVVIPNQALYQSRYVYLVVSGKLQRRDVSVSWQDDNNSVITSGLEPGELLVTTALGQVVSGTAVRTRPDSGPDGGESKSADEGAGL